MSRTRWHTCLCLFEWPDDETLVLKTGDFSNISIVVSHLHYSPTEQFSKTKLKASPSGGHLKENKIQIQIDI